MSVKVEESSEIDAALLAESLDFSLDGSLEDLSTVQLCLVQFHPEADEATKNRAELIYWRRRNRAQAVAARRRRETPVQPAVAAPPPAAGANNNADRAKTEDNQGVKDEAGDAKQEEEQALDGRPAAVARRAGEAFTAPRRPAAKAESTAGTSKREDIGADAEDAKKKKEEEADAMQVDAPAAAKIEQAVDAKVERPVVEQETAGPAGKTKKEEDGPTQRPDQPGQGGTVAMQQQAQLDQEVPELNDRLDALRARLRADPGRRGVRSPVDNAPPPTALATVQAPPANAAVEPNRLTPHQISLIRRMAADETIDYPADPAQAAVIFNELATAAIEAGAEYASTIHAREKKEVARLRKIHQVSIISQQDWLRRAPPRIVFSGQPLALLADGTLYLNPMRFTRYLDRYKTLRIQAERALRLAEQQAAQRANQGQSGVKRPRSNSSGSTAAASGSTSLPSKPASPPNSPNKKARTGKENVFLGSPDVMSVRARNNDTAPTYVRFASHAKVDRLVQLQAALGNPGSLEETLDRLTMLGAEDKASLPDYHFWCQAILSILAYGGRGEREADRAAAFAAGLQELEKDVVGPQRGPTAHINKKLDELQEELSTLAGGDEGMEIDGFEDIGDRRKDRSPAPSVSTVAAAENSRRLGSSAGASAGSALRGRPSFVRFRSEESVIPPAEATTAEIKAEIAQVREEMAKQQKQSTAGSEAAPTAIAEQERPREQQNDARRAVDMEVDEKPDIKSKAAADGDGTPGRGKVPTGPASQTSTPPANAPKQPAAAAAKASATAGRPATPPSEPKPKIPPDIINDLICVFVNQIPWTITHDQFLEWIRSVPGVRPVAVSQLSKTVDNSSQYTRVYFWTQEEAQAFILAMRNHAYQAPNAGGGEIAPNRLAMTVMKQKQKRPNVAWTDCFDDDAVQKLVHLGNKLGKQGMPDRSILTGEPTKSQLPFNSRLGGTPTQPAAAATSGAATTATAQRPLPARPQAAASGGSTAGGSLASRLTDVAQPTATGQQSHAQPQARPRNSSGGSSNNTASNSSLSATQAQSALLTRLSPAGAPGAAAATGTATAGSSTISGSASPPVASRNSGGNRQPAPSIFDRFDGPVREERRPLAGQNGQSDGGQDERRDTRGANGLLSRMEDPSYEKK